MTSQTQILTDRDWRNVDQEYERSEPFHVAVIDDLLDDNVRETLHSALLDHYAWRYRNWVNQYLTNYQPEIAEITQLADQIRARLKAVDDGIHLVKHWAIMLHRNVGLIPHADNGSVILNYWLTPDEFNLDSESGGMRFYDVSRPSDVYAAAFGVEPGSKEYVRSRTRGESMRVPYACNRGILFDARVFHASEPVNFKGNDPASCRMNLTMVFDDPEEYVRREQRGDEFADQLDAQD